MIMIYDHEESERFSRYRCRVDFQHQQTQFTNLDLRVVRPPGKPTITTGGAALFFSSSSVRLMPIAHLPSRIEHLVWFHCLYFFHLKDAQSMYVGAYKMIHPLFGQMVLLV